jgi:hypothetical protein
MAGRRPPPKVIDVDLDPYFGAKLVASKHQEMFAAAANDRLAGHGPVWKWAAKAASTIRRVTRINHTMRKERTAMTYARRILLAVFGLMAALVAVPIQASAASLDPFHATVAETFTAALCDPLPSLCVTTAGIGHATHLGRIRESATIVTDLASNPAPGCHNETRKTTLTAANGDQITLDATGQNCATGPTTVTAVDAYVVTGGTGRFAGAIGNGTITAQIDLASRTALVTFGGLLSSLDEEEEDED